MVLLFLWYPYPKPTKLMKRSRFRTVPLTRLAVAALASISIPANAGSYSTDFTTDPFDPALPITQRLTIFTNQAATSPNRPSWVPSGGVGDSGYLKLTDAIGGIRSTVIFPDFEPGFHVAGFNFGVDCRLGGGGVDPADGFSINFARASVIGGAVDPVLIYGGVNASASPPGYAGANNVGHTEANRHEEGTMTGLGIGFDAYFSGGEDKIGISVRVDDTLLTQVELPFKNLATTDTNYSQSLQTGPRLPDPATPAERVAALSWERFEVELDPATKRLDVWWKGVKVIDQLETNFEPGPGRLVFGARTGGQNQVHHFDNLTLETFPVELATVTSAKVSHTGFVFEITDYGTESVVTPADLDFLSINGSDNLLSEATVVKEGNVTRITWAPPTPFAPHTSIPYVIEAFDQNSELVRADGGLVTPILPLQFFITEEPTLNQWNIRELRDGTVSSTGTPAAVINSALAIAANPPGRVENYTAPYFNLTDDNNFGDRGFFKRDTLYVTNTAGTDDNNIVGLGRTKIEIAEAGDYTFWVRSDDGFALRVNGASFHKVAGTIAGTNGAQIDSADSSTIAFLDGTGNSNTRGTVNLDAGEYVIDFLWFEGTGGSYVEVSWAAGDHTDDTTGGRWNLVGGAGDTPFFPAAPLAGPELPAAGGWAVRNYYNGGDVPTLRAAFERIANPGESLVANATTPVVNFRDPNNAGADGLFNNNIPFPMEAVVAPPIDDNHFVTIARHELNIATAGDYTFAVTSDDGFAFRILGGPYLINHAAPLNNSAGADPLDSSAFLNSGAHGEASYGVYRVTEPGDYIIEVVQVEQTGGASLEVAWAPGNHTHRNGTSAWQLVGNPGDPSLPPLVPVIPDDVFVALPLAEEGTWSIRFYYPNPAAGVGSLAAAFDVARNPSSLFGGGLVPYLNHFNRPISNPGTGTHGLFHSNRTDQYALAELYFLGAGLDATVDNMMALATARVVIPADGLYTFGVNTDDGFALRIVDAPNGFRRLSGTATTLIDMAQPNTIYRSGGTASNRAVIELTAGQYDIEFAFYEAGGAAGFELFAAAGDFTNEGDTTAWRAIGHTSSGGLTIVAQPVDPGPGDDTLSISEFDFDSATGDFSFTWGSEEAGAYDIEYSIDLVTWHSLEVGYPGDEGATTTYSGNISDLTAIEDTEKVFFRLRTVD